VVLLGLREDVTTCRAPIGKAVRNGDPSLDKTQRRAAAPGATAATAESRGGLPVRVAQGQVRLTADRCGPVDAGWRVSENTVARLMAELYRAGDPHGRGQAAPGLGDGRRLLAAPWRMLEANPQHWQTTPEASSCAGK
jgi:hypothetical protein